MVGSDMRRREERRDMRYESKGEGKEGELI